MKLLQVPTASLEQRVKEELEVNPALDEGKVEDTDEDNENEADNSGEIDLTDYLSDDEGVASYKLKTHNYRDPDENKTIPIPVTNTFHEYLVQQLGMVMMTVEDRTIAEQIIGSIDDDGYLRRDLEAIVDDLSFSANLETNEVEVERVLQRVQLFDPGGVGARNLQECLLIQISKKQSNKYLNIAEDLLENHFTEFTKKHYEKIARQLSITEADLKEAIGEILKLNPKPGSGYSSGAKVENYIIPDFIIVNDNGMLKLNLNGKNAPELRISDNYKSMMQDYASSKVKDRKQKEAIQFIKHKIDAARWFIDAIRQRQQTMFKSMQAILDYQYTYFYTGDKTRLKPMILKDIAERTGLDISTISRVANSKYVQTEFGTFSLKSFFSESLSTQSGEEVSTREVKEILKKMINEENKRKPLSDQKLTEHLRLKGYNIARRTVAKYREQLNIPVARLRKEL
ncbi:UNVERIFIED_CONTAM: hypothetical protein GTU68_061347 [Idotea baltica]|nr:hypothetical protein [Idotea baltica]